MPLEGKLVILREERREDLDLLRELRNNLDTQAWSKTLPPDFTEPMYVKRFEEREFSYSPNQGRFSVVVKETGQLAGHIGYSHLEPRLSANLGIAIAKDFWGTGVAFDAQEVLVEFLFVELGLRVVRLWTHSGNPQAVGLAQKSGFQVSAQMREAIYKGGELYDNVIMDLLREEYFARHLELSDPLPAGV